MRTKLAKSGRLGNAGTHWALSALYQNEGTIPGTDATGLPTTDFSAGSGAATVAIAQAFGRNVSLGLAGKYVMDALGPGHTGSGVTFDAGVSLQFGALGFGIAAQNVGGRMTYESQAFAFPESWGAGASFTHAASGLTVACDVNVPRDSYKNVRGGVEWNWRQHVALRAGYRSEVGAPPTESLSGPTFGTGMGAHGLWLDYGYLVSGESGGQHRIAITLRSSALHGTDPFGQSSMPRDFDSHRPMGPPAPKSGK